MPAATREALVAAAATQLSLPSDDEHLPGKVDAVVALAGRWHGLHLGEEWPADKFTGYVMLAAKLHRRRNSPDAITIDQQYGPMYVAKHDPDISALLGLDRYMPPKAV